MKTKEAPTLDWIAVPSHVAEGPAEVRHKDGWLVCEVPADSYARLIAAAPELLEALHQVLATGLNGGNNVRLAYIAAGGKELSDELLAKADASEKAVEFARAALAKAGA